MSLPHQPAPVRIGTAGWSIPRDHTHLFPGADSHLARYARTLSCAEINATFYRLPRTSTLARWLQSVPPHFRFSVKAPRSITHEAALACTPAALRAFLDAIAALGPTLGPILFQLPPSLAFDHAQALAFFDLLRDQTTHPVVLEPRHPTWFTPAADTILLGHRIARAAADPARTPAAAAPGGWPGLTYFRLHGSPRTYYSPYTEEYLANLALTLRSPRPASTEAPDRWCIFDNTASGAAIANALTLTGLLAGPHPTP